MLYICIRKQTNTNNLKFNIMKYFKATVTNDFKNSSKIKLFNAKFFVAKYNPTIHNPETNFKFIIDKEDDRRLVLILSEKEIDELLEHLNSLKNN